MIRLFNLIKEIKGHWSIKVHYDNIIYTGDALIRLFEFEEAIKIYERVKSIYPEVDLYQKIGFKIILIKHMLV